ncbi:MAG: hypothetical protein PHO93_03410, partial [Candidatus Saccharimonadaceae bacterium]|nr:hypothetical protein [Candidatus Saccharimonadaceae bacterium]
MVKEILKEKHLEICSGTVKKFILRPAVLCLFIILLVTGIYGIYTYDKTFPLAEGWYSVYAKMVKEGKIPYKDFELLYTPFYLYIITFITFVFGENII